MRQTPPCAFAITGFKVNHQLDGPIRGESSIGVKNRSRLEMKMVAGSKLTSIYRNFLKRISAIAYALTA
jgi:hypothetical protein